MNFRVAGLASCMLFACGGAAKPATDAIAIGTRLASDSRDWEAHRDLARLRLAEGGSGEALREFLALERLDRLSLGDRSELATLLLARGKKRLALGDPAALDDFDHAGRLGSEPPAAQKSALALAAAAALRHSGASWQNKAASHLARLQEMDESDPRVHHQDLDSLSLDALVTVLHWFTVEGAKRQALRVAEAYVEKGGRHPPILDQWLDLHQWWYGRRRPPLPSDVAKLVEGPPTRLELFHSQLVDEQQERAQGTSKHLVQSWRLSSWASDLIAVEEAFRVDPARSDRKARAFVDRDVYGARERAVLVELYYRLGDSKRSKVWALELMDLSPGNPAFVLSAGLACAADGDVERAEQYFTSAAAASGDPGRYWALAARTLRFAGHPIAALRAGRRALALTAPGRDLMILLELSRAQSALGRDLDAGRTLETLLQRLPESKRQTALLRIEAGGAGAPKDIAQRPAFLESIRWELGVAVTCTRCGILEIKRHK